MRKKKETHLRYWPSIQVLYDSWHLIAAGSILFFGGVGLLLGLRTPSLHELLGKQVAIALKPYLMQNRLPTEVACRTFPLNCPAPQDPAQLQYTLNADLQKAMENWVEQYRPDHAAVVALDAKSGNVLVWINYHHHRMTLVDDDNLTMRAQFPAASVFKIITSVAALDQGKSTPTTEIAFSGRKHTLYRRALARMDPNHGATRLTLRDAFAQSVNGVFGKIGFYWLTPDTLAHYATQFGFDRTAYSDLFFEPGHFEVPEPNSFGMAEAASGFNRQVVLSPVHAALIASTVANFGSVILPHIVRRIRIENKIIYEERPTRAWNAVSPPIASQVRTLMEATIQKGTSRVPFRTLLRKRAFAHVDFGGKTGSLHSALYRGKCDWFVGYAETPFTNLAIAVLTIHGDQWRVKSSYLARLFFEKALLQLDPEIAKTYPRRARAHPHHPTASLSVQSFGQQYLNP